MFADPSVITTLLTAVKIISNFAGSKSEPPIRAHSQMTPIPPKKGKSNRSSETTSSTDRTYSTPTDTTKKCTDSFCTDNYTTETPYTVPKSGLPL